MVYHDDIPIGPEPIPFGAIITLVDGEMVRGTYANMRGVANRPRWAVFEAAYEPGTRGKFQSEGYVLAILPDGSNTMMVNLRGGRIE